MSYGAAVELTSLLSPESRIIDVGPTGFDVVRRLAEDGYGRYLGLIAPEQLAAARRQVDGLADRLHPLTSASQVVRNSTDLLILRGPFVRHLWFVPDLRHIRYVAIEAGSSRAAVEGRVAALAGRVTGKMTVRGRHSCGTERFQVVEVGGRRAPRPRRYLSPVWGVTGFVRRLEDAGLRYVFLRWFDRLPSLEPGEDLDMLVADQDLAKVEELLGQEPGTIPVDLYSETGLPGSDYQGMAYYPPTLARHILKRSVTHVSGARVPAPEDHLRSLAFHAVYHKGIRSGLPSSILTEKDKDPEHDYGAALQGIARTLGVHLAESLDGVDEYLEGEGWRPPLDTLLRLTDSNPWIRARFFTAKQVTIDPPEPTVFLLRERTTPVVSTDDVLALLDHLGFDVLTVRDLDGPARERCAAHTRGGNWGGGPFAESGGPPTKVILALHHAPRLPTAALRARYPRLSNVDILLAKQRIRDLVNGRLADAQHFNPVHSSDDALEAWEYIRLALPDEMAELRAEVSRRRAQYRTNGHVLKVLSRGRRAKVEVMQGQHGLVVRKTFANGYLRHMERELQGLRELRPHVGAVPELLDSGPNWFTRPYYEDELSEVWAGNRLLPLRVVREMVGVLRRIHDQGFDLIDAKPQNFMLDPRQGLKLVDFEFLHRYHGPPPDFTASYGIVGVPDGFPGDLPVSDFSYNRRWRRYTGLSPHALVESPAWSQHVHRALFRLRKATLGSQGRIRRSLRLSRHQLRRTRRLVGREYARWTRYRASA